MTLLARDLTKKIESDLVYPGQYQGSPDPRDPRG
jgi:hypothetical protein